MNSSYRPPCPPRVYDKLYEYLESVLPKTGRKTPLKRPTNRTTPAKRAIGGAATDGYEIPEERQSTPLKNEPNTTTASTPASKRKHVTQETTTTTGPKKIPRQRAPKKQLTNSTIPDAPAWTLRVIRNLNETLTPDVKALPPHVYSGLSSILSWTDVAPSATPGKTKNKTIEPVAFEPNTPDNQPIKTLIVAIYNIVVTRMIQTDTIDAAAYKKRVETGLEALGVPTTLWTEVDAWLLKIQKEEWAVGKQWLENVPCAADLEAEDDERHEDDVDGTGIPFRAPQDEDQAAESSPPQPATITPTQAKSVPRKTTVKPTRKTPAKTAAKSRQPAPTTKSYRPKTKAGSAFLLKYEDDDKRPGLLPGLGTMMQPAVDYLNEDHRIEFVKWKEEFEKKLAAAEKALAATGGEASGSTVQV